MEVKLLQIDGEYNPCDCVINHIDSNGIIGIAPEDEKRRYLYYRRRLLVSELACSLYLAFFCFGSLLTVYKEAKFGSHWPIAEVGIEISLWILVSLGAILGLFYCYYICQFARHGSEQRDNAVGNIVAVIVTFASCIGLLAKYFTVTDIEDPIIGYNFKRSVQVVFYGYGLTMVSVTIKSLLSHWAIHKEVLINCVHNDGSRSFMKEVIDLPPTRVFAFVFTMIICSGSLVSISIWIVISTVGNPNPVLFDDLFFATNGIWGATFVALIMSWILWNFTVIRYKESFLASFERFFISSILHISITIMMMMGYKIFYWHVQDDIYGGQVVPALKFTYLSKIGTLCLISLLPTCIGMTKIGHLMIGKWPVKKKKE